MRGQERRERQSLRSVVKAYLLGISHKMDKEMLTEGIKVKRQQCPWN